MGFIDWLKEAKDRLFTKEVRIFNAGETPSINNLPWLGSWFWTAQLGMPRGIDIVNLRKYAKSSWVQMVENAICRQIMTTEWDIVPSDEIENAKSYEEQIKKVKKILSYPNRNGDTFWDVWNPFLRDVLELDAGVVFKNKNGSGELKELYAYDGSRFLFKVDGHGIIEGFYQYSFKSPKAQPTFFKKEEIIYGQVNKNTELYPYGFSVLESIQAEVELMIQSTKQNKDFFQNNSIPDGVVTVPMEKTQLERFKHYWQTEVKGKSHKLVFHNVEGTSFTPFRMSNKDMEWLDGQKWFFHVVFGAFGLSPQEVGFYENSNRATSDSQERLTIKNAIKPYLALIESKINREIIPEIIGTDEVKFKWFLTDSAQEKIEHEQKMQKLQANVYTINEVRGLEGLDDVEWGHKPMNLILQERFVELGGSERFEGKKETYRNREDNEKDKDEKSEEREEQRKLIDDSELKKDFIEEDEAKDYADFLEKKFRRWGSQIDEFLERTIKDEIQKDIVSKSFGEFLQRLFNSVNTAGFSTGLKKAIKKNLSEGIEEAEKELNVNIGFSENISQKLDLEVNRQLEGFTIDGKKWGGIKGVAKDVQKEIMMEVESGIREGKTLSQIKNAVLDTMVKYHGGEINGRPTDGKAMVIARTESNRYRNSAKMQAFKDSGLSGKKEWKSKIDSHTSDICRRLDGQVVDMDDFFVDPETGKKYFAPPSLPNCRSSLVLLPRD